jgi:hypothetical protein
MGRAVEVDRPGLAGAASQHAYPGPLFGWQGIACPGNRRGQVGPADLLREVAAVDPVRNTWKALAVSGALTAAVALPMAPLNQSSMG